MYTQSMQRSNIKQTKTNPVTVELSMIRSPNFIDPLHM
jgi:hypothetical protein